MRFYKLLFLVFGLIILSQTNFAQYPIKCDKSLTYENKNQVNPEPLLLNEISGIVRDKENNLIVEACVGIFKNKKLIKVTSTDEDGKFKFDFSKSGKYTLIVEFYPFCTANIPVELKKDKFNKQNGISVLMKSAGIDDCSYGDYIK